MAAYYSLFMNQSDDDSDDDYDLEEDIALFLYCRQKQYDPGYILRQKARDRRAFYDTLTIDEKRKRRMSIPVCALRPVSQSAARAVLESLNSQAMIPLTGFDYPSFDFLLQRFRPYFNENSPTAKDLHIHRKKSPRGRKRLITAKDCLALYLAWTRTKGGYFVLQMLFGMSHTNVSVYLRFARRILECILSNDDLARIKRPSVEEIDDFKRRIGERYPLCEDACFVMDAMDGSPSIGL